MIDFFEPTEPYGAQAARLVAETQYGAADVFEVGALCATLSPGDAAGWQKGWTALAEGAVQEAIAAEQRGHRTTAIERFFHAASYFRQSDVFTSPGDPRRPEVFARAQTAFRRAARLHRPEIRIAEVPCGDQLFDGYYCLPPAAQRGRRVPGILVIGGVDSYAEESYFRGRGLLDRDMAVLVLDPPGHGAAVYLKRIPMRPDYEVPGKAALDWLALQAEVDPARLGVVGIGMGAYYAARAAAFDARVKALVAWSGTMRLLEDLYLFFPPVQRQIQWLLGAPDETTARTRLANYSLARVAGRIQAPTLVVHGRNDRVMNVRGAEQFYAAVAARDKELRVLEGPGSGHCLDGSWRTAIPLMFDWLKARLG